MAPLTHAAVSTGFLQPRKIATQVKMRQKRKCIQWSESLFISFLNSPLSYRPCRVCWLLLSLPALGARHSVHVVQMPPTMRVGQGKVQRNPLWPLREKVTVIFHWSAAETGNLTQEQYQCRGKTSPRWDFHQNQVEWKTVQAQHLSVSGSTRYRITMAEPLI